MKICIIGDPHGDIKKVKKINLSGVDLILLTGDLGKSVLARKMAFKNIERKQKGLSPVNYPAAHQKKAYMESVNSTIVLIKYLVKFAPVRTIFGNVEYSKKSTKKLSEEIKIKLPFIEEEINKIRGAEVVNDKLLRFKNLEIGCLQFFTDVEWARTFMPENQALKIRAEKQTKRAEKALKKFGSADILLCHQPPYGIMDKIVAAYAPKKWQGLHAGSKLILKYIKTKQPKYVFCGHIHEGQGMQKIGKTEIHNLGECGYKIIEV
ncbi:MAG: metallophosphoesterase family protein [Candidatus Nanoarchaeia archaeon]